MQSSQPQRPRRRSEAVSRKAKGRLIAPVALALFALVVALTGGSSRSDIYWLVVLRPVTMLFITGLLLAGDVAWRRVTPVLILLAALAVTIGLQLVPLPPSLWLGLNGRAPYDGLARMLGQADEWRPLALSPDAAWNSLASLLVPLGVILGFAALSERQRVGLLLPLLCLVAFTMLLGIAQIAGGEGSPLYWYRVSGRGQLIGLFANRNHQGALLAMALPLLRAWVITPSAGDERVSRTRGIVGLAAAAVIILYAIILGSRSGLVLTLIGIVAAFLVDPSVRTLGRSSRVRWLIAATSLIGIAGLLGLALSADRAASINRMVDNDLSTEARLAALPTLMHIVASTMPVGTGFGSFVPVWSSYEPDTLLKPQYFNNAHNDLIELAITGGVPAVTVLAAFLAWWMRAGWRGVISREGRTWRPLERASWLAIMIALMASLTDYPLRTPLMGAIFAILCCWLAREPRDKVVGRE